MSRSVYQIYGGMLRFGNVKEEKIENGWKFYKIDWVDDEAYNASVANKLFLRREEYNPEWDWYRTDKVNFFDPDEMISRINMLKDDFLHISTVSWEDRVRDSETVMNKITAEWGSNG
jgi:hypothetical protein